MNWLFKEIVSPFYKLLKSVDGKTFTHTLCGVGT